MDYVQISYEKQYKISRFFWKAISYQFYSENLPELTYAAEPISMWRSRFKHEMRTREYRERKTYSISCYEDAKNTKGSTVTRNIMKIRPFSKGCENQPFLCSWQVEINATLDFIGHGGRTDKKFSILQTKVAFNVLIVSKVRG